MRKRLLLQALCKLFLSIAVTASLIFVSAGTLHYWNGWLFLCIWFVPMILLGTVLLIKKPELLKKRLSGRETNKTQKLVRAFGVFMFLTGFLLAGLSCRFGWLRLSDWIAWTGSVLFLLSYLLCGEVLRENAYLSRTVEIQKDQKVIDTGLYGIVRHPMYGVTIMKFLSIPLILGSILPFIAFLGYPVLLAKRIQNEEAVLEKGLAGYAAYQQRVRYKMLPYIW